MPEICKKCASYRKTCCYHSRITLTISEIKKWMSKGYKTEELLVARKYKKEGDWDPEWNKNMAIKIGKNKYELCLKRKDNGACPFLGEKGCTIKPNSFLCCKVFPFWSTENKIEYDKDKDLDCPLIKIPEKETLKLFGETEESIRKYMSEMKQDAKTNKEKRTEILKYLVDKKNII
jgi:hypothetical protein